MDKPEKAENAFKAYSTLKQMRHLKGEIDIELAAQLSFLKKDKNYRLITGDEDSTWAEFLADPELPVRSQSTANRLIAIYDTYVVGLEVKPEELYGLDTNCLQRATTIVNRENVKEWLAKIEHLSRSDFYRLMKFGDKDETKCEHDLKKKYTLMQCSKCGFEKRE